MNIDKSQIYEVYKNRLLDLSSRNRLISFKMTKRNIDMFSFKDFNVLEILNNEEIRIGLSTYVDKSVKLKTSSEMSEEEIEEIKENANNEFKGYLQNFKKIVRKSQSDFRETGRRTLYLCHYFISGTLYGDNTVKMYAPLFLIPVECKTTQSSIILKRTDEDILINRTIIISLMKTLKGKIDLPSYEFTELNNDILMNLIQEIRKLDVIVEEDLEFQRFPIKKQQKNSDNFIVKNHLIFSNIDASNSLLNDYEQIGDSINKSISDLLNDDIVPNQNSENLKREYREINLTNRELSLISKLDTSQELAVYMAKKSNNLVIYGPPGTGKTETILNIISDNVSNGKRVLVVSEKKAAINVLYNRLMDLQQLSLMFDSENVKMDTLKSRIIKNLGTDFVFNESNMSFEESLKRLESCYMYFNNIFNILNTLYKGRKISDWFNEFKKEVDISSKSREDIEYLIYRHQHMRRILDLDYDDFKNFIKKINDTYLIKTYKYLTSNNKRSEILEKIFNANLANTKDFLFELYYFQEKRNLLEEKNSEILKLKTKEEEITSEIKQLSCSILIQEKLDEINKDIANIEEGLNNSFQEVNSYKELTAKIISEFSEDKFKAFEREIGKNLLYLSIEISELLRETVSSYRIYLQEKQKILNKIFKNNKIENKYFLFESDRDICMEKLTESISQIEDSIIKGKAFLRVLQAEKDKLLEKQKSDILKLEEVKKELDVNLKNQKNLKDFVNQESNNLPENIPNLIQMYGNLSNLFTNFKDIDLWIEIIKEYRNDETNLRELVISNKNLIDLYKFLDDSNLLGKDYTEKLLWEIYLDLQVEQIQITYKENLNAIEDYENIQEIYRNSENSYFYETRKKIVSNIITKRQNYNNNPEYQKKERNFLKEIQKKTRSIKTKQFMKAYFEIIQDYFPITLATPDAVSKYFPLIKDSYDIVVFDEASQLVIEKAIPSIYRAQKIIVVGDDKQLKPSSFFKNKIDTEDEVNAFMDEEIEEEDMLFLPDSLVLSSLLDLAKTKYNSVSLLFHYRSKFAELIDFSNAVFYKGQLKLAPNVLRQNLNRAIIRKKVDGIWEDNQNKIEAQEVVNTLKSIFKNRKEDETIGIITFNSKQKECIENLIEQETSEDSDFASLFLKEANRFNEFEDNSLFVKNIENVQGDERDIIIFSVGYSYDATGKLSTNFGPLSAEGGENRLNVAISRAKKKVYVITSFEPEELNVENSKNEGSRIFKDYLIYSKYISEANQEAANNLLNKYRINSNIIEEKKFDSPFEEQVYKVLSEKGYIVDTQVGCYGFRIDLAIYDEKKGRYILGIECDGASYHSSKNVKDRDIARQAFLESRGWNIYRIWSTTWWKNQNVVITKLEEKIKELSIE